MMQTLLCNIQNIALLFHVFMHQCNSCRLIIIRTDVHALNAQALIISQEFDL